MHDHAAPEPPSDDPNATASRPRPRRLAAVLFSDIEGFSQAMQADEEATMKLLDVHNRLMDEQLERHHGSRIKGVGDGYMVEFGSVVAAVTCALDVQRRFAEHNQALDPKRQLRVRIGVHMGEVVVQDGDLLGHDVNVAARLQGEAPVGGVCVCEEDFARVRGKVNATVTRLGPRPLKNIGTLELYALWPADERLVDVPFPDAAELPEEESRRLTVDCQGLLPSRAELVRKVILDLGTEAPGVALLAPRGFGGREVVERIVEILHEPSRPELVVRLMPDPDSTGEVRLYGAMLRDLRRGLERELGKSLAPAWSAPFPDPERPASEEAFEETVEKLLDGPVQEERRTLVLVVEGLSRVDPKHLVRWAWLINRLTTDRPLKILAWGGQSLYDLCTGYADLAHTSPFERLARHQVGPWPRDEVATLVADRCGASAPADGVYGGAGGHPALVRELLAGASEAIRRGDADGVHARALNSAHLRQLRSKVERDAAARKELARMGGGGDLRRHNESGEERLRWLGIIAEGEGASWKWTAPVMRDWAGQWLGAGAGV